MTLGSRNHILTVLHLNGSSKSLGGILLRFWRSKSVCAAMITKSVLLLAFQLLGSYGNHGRPIRWVEWIPNPLCRDDPINQQQR